MSADRQTKVTELLNELCTVENKAYHARSLASRAREKLLGEGPALLAAGEIDLPHNEGFIDEVLRRLRDVPSVLDYVIDPLTAMESEGLCTAEVCATGAASEGQAATTG